MSWTTMKPLGARVLVKLLPEQESWGLLEIPDYWRRQQEAALVLAVGSRTPRDVAVGDTVVTGKWNGDAVPNPANDPDAEYGTYRLLDGDYEKRGEKLAVPNACRTHLPHIPGFYGVIEREGESDAEVIAKIASNMPKPRSA